MQPDVASTWVLEKSQIFSNNAKFTLTLMSKENWIFLLQIKILHFKYVWNLHSLSLARFFLIMDNRQCGLIILSISLIKQFNHFFSFQIHTTPSRGISRILKPEENQNLRKFLRARCPWLKPFQFTLFIIKTVFAQFPF